jgi:hypothetical protein
LASRQGGRHSAARFGTQHSTVLTWRGKLVFSRAKEIELGERQDIFEKITIEVSNISEATSLKT